MIIPLIIYINNIYIKYRIVRDTIYTFIEILKGPGLEAIADMRKTSAKTYIMHIIHASNSELRGKALSLLGKKLSILFRWDRPVNPRLKALISIIENAKIDIIGIIVEVKTSGSCIINPCSDPLIALSSLLL
jgi:hypothetical protein